MSRWLGCVLAVALCGCGLTQSFGPTRVDRLLLVVSPTAMNFDGRPGLDGFSGTLYGYSRAQPKSVQLPDGSVEFLLYRGAVAGEIRSGQDGELPAPTQTVSYTSSDLKLREVSLPIGAAYRFGDVTWDAESFPEGDVTLVARFVPTSGESIWTKPISLTVPR